MDQSRMDDTVDFEDDAKFFLDPATIGKISVDISLSDAKSVASSQYSHVVKHHTSFEPPFDIWDKPPNFRDLEWYDNPFAWAVESYSKGKLTRLYDAACSKYRNQRELKAFHDTPLPDFADQPIYHAWDLDLYQRILPSGAKSRPKTFVPDSVEDLEHFFVSNIKNCYIDKPNIGMVAISRGSYRRWARVLLQCKELDRDKLPEQTDPETLQTTFASPYYFGKEEQFDEIGRVTFYQTIWRGPGWYAIRRLCQNEWCQNLAHMDYEMIIEGNDRPRCPGGRHCQHTKQCLNVGPDFFTDENKNRIKLRLQKRLREIGFWKACMDYAVAKETDSNVDVPILSDTDTMSFKVQLERVEVLDVRTPVEVPPDLKNSYPVPEMANSSSS